MTELTELHLDAIRESINISMGKAAATFSSMVSEHVSLSVPHLEFVTPDKTLNVLNINTESEMHYVFQKFKSEYFTSDVYLMFAREESLDLVKLFLGPDSDIHEMPQLEQEAITEIGNILLNACVGSLSNLLKSAIHGSLPEFRKGYARNIFNAANLRAAEDDMLMVVFINFGVESKAIHGYILLVLDLDSFEKFKDHILKMLL